MWKLDLSKHCLLGFKALAVHGQFLSEFFCFLACNVSRLAVASSITSLFI